MNRTDLFKSLGLLPCVTKVAKGQATIPGTTFSGLMRCQLLKLTATFTASYYPGSVTYCVYLRGELAIFFLAGRGGTRPFNASLILFSSSAVICLFFVGFLPPIIIFKHLVLFLLLEPHLSAVKSWSDSFSSRLGAISAFYRHAFLCAVCLQDMGTHDALQFLQSFPLCSIKLYKLVKSLFHPVLFRFCSCERQILQALFPHQS